MIIISLAQRWRRELCIDLSGLRAPIAVKGALVCPGGPDNSREAISERDSGLVVAALAFAIESPPA
jgi:hypothetical protein